MVELKKYKWLLLLLAICFVATLPSLKKAQQVDDHRSVIMDGIGFKIPKNNYVPTTVPRNNSISNSILLILNLPEVKSKQEKNYKLEKRDASTAWTAINSLKRNGKSIKNIAEILKFNVISDNPKVYLDKKYNLYYIDSSYRSNVYFGDIYYEGKFLDPQTVIFCHSPEKNPDFVLQCKMYFYYKGLIVSVRFNKEKWFLRWQDIKIDMLKKLEAFHQDYSENKIVTKE